MVEEDPLVNELLLEEAIEEPNEDTESSDASSTSKLSAGPF